MDKLNNHDFLMKLVGKSGVYFISQELPPDNDKKKKFLVKVGLAAAKKDSKSAKNKGGLRNRIEQYLLYYPRGFNIFGLVLTTKENAHKVEKKIQGYLTGKNRKANFPHSRTEEWYYMTQADIIKTIKIHTKDNPMVIDHHSFDPYYVLTSNPTAGKQRKVTALHTPERKVIDRKSTVSTPPSTIKKRKRPASHQSPNTPTRQNPKSPRSPKTPSRQNPRASSQLNTQGPRIRKKLDFKP